MIASKLIIQSVLGVGALASIVGGSYMLMGSSDDYFLVTSVAETTASNQPTDDLWTEKKPSIKVTNTASVISDASTLPVPIKSEIDTKIQKNYKCQSTVDNKEKDDTNCELYSIAYDQTNKSIHFEGLKKALEKPKKVTEKSDLTDKKFFLIKASSSLYSEWKFDGKETIKLLSNSSDTEQKTKSYATLIVYGKILNNEFIGMSDKSIGMFKTTDNTTSLTSSTTYKCKFKNPTNSKAQTCIVTELGNPDTNPTLNNLNFSSITIPATQTATTITANKYYAIKWTDKNWNTSLLKNNVVVIVDITNLPVSTPKKEIEIELKSVLFGEFTAGKHEAIIIK